MGLAAAAVTAITGVLGDIGITGGLATGLAGGLLGATAGAGLGAGEAALTGGNVGTGALLGGATGGLTGGAIGGFGSLVGGALGIGTTAGDTLVGAGAGALGSELTGGNPLTGALTGGAGGLATGAAGQLFGGGSDAATGAGVASTDPSGTVATLAPTGVAPTGGSAGVGAGSVAAPAATALGAPADLSSSLAASAVGSPPAGIGTGAGTGTALSDLGLYATNTSPVSAGSGSSGPASGGNLFSGVLSATSAGEAAAAGAGALSPAGDLGGIGSAGSIVNALDLGYSAGGDGIGGAPTPAAAATGITGGAGPTLGGYTTGDVPAGSVTAPTGSGFPIPPQSPALDPATGNPITNAAGAPVYSTPGQASYAGVQTAADLAGYPTPAQPAGGFLGTLGNAFSSIGSNPLQLAGVAAAGLGLTKDLLTANKPNPIPGMSDLQTQAQSDITQGNLLQSYLTTGTLPPAVQTAVQAATQAGMTDIRARYAAMGVAPGSSAETADIQNLQQNAVIQGATLAENLLQQGISESNLGAGIYNELVGYNTTLNNQTNSAIGNLATALAGGGTRITIGGTNSAAAA